MKRDGILLLVVLSTSCGRTAKDIQMDHAASLTPAPLGDPNAPPRKTRKLLARVWADEAHRNMTIGWEVRVYRQVQRANRVLSQQLGVEIEIESAKSWDRPSDLSGLQSALFDLERFDPGDDVDFVIGLTSALPAVTASIHQLGVARVFGKHMVLRGMDDAEEFSALARVLGKLDQNDWERVYNARVRHKEAVVLLHEIGHTVGAIHVRDQRSLMNPQVTKDATTFANVNARLMLVGLKAKGEGSRDPATRETVRKELVELLERTKSRDFLDSARERALSMLGAPTRLAQSTDAEFAPPEQPATGERRLAPPPPDPVQEAQRLTVANDVEAAWILIAEQLEAEPKSPRVVSVACDVAVRRAPEAEQTESICRSAVALAPDMLQLRFHIAYALMRQRKRSEALEVLRDVQSRVEKSTDASSETWAQLAQMYRSASAVTLAELAAAKAPDDENAKAVTAWAENVRKVYGLTAIAATPVEEATYVAARIELEEAVRKRDWAAAAVIAKAQPSDKFMTLAVRLCELLADAQELDRALPVCERAVKAAPDSAKTHAVIGFVLFSKRRIGPGVRHLERALALRPDEQSFWRVLKSAYLATGQRAKLHALSRRYEARFNQPLR